MKRASGLSIEKEISVSTYDTDYAGHVSNISYLRWLEDMRLMLFNEYFPFQDFLDDNKTPVLASTNIKYKRAIKLFDRPHGVMWVSDVSLATLTINAEIYVDGQLATTAEHVGAFIDLRTHRPIRIPSIIVEKFKKHLAVPIER